MFASRKNRTSRSVFQAVNQTRPTFEMLEERQHFSVVSVTNTNDTGTGSLRAAMQAVNAGQDTVIDFNIPNTSHGYSSSTKTWTITPLSPLPVMTKAVMIDGYSQPGYSNSPLVKINGRGLEFAAPHSTLRGMEVENANAGVILDSTSSADVIVGNTITGCYSYGVDVNSAGNTIGAVGHANLILNTSAGVGLAIQANGNTVVRNTISGTAVGIGVQGNGNTIQANTVSATASGEAIGVNGLNNLVGGTSSGDGNVVKAAIEGIDVGENSNVVLGNSVTMQGGDGGIESSESQAAPVLSSAEEYLGKLTVIGSVKSQPFSIVRVELFASAPTSSNDEGQVFLGYVSVKTNELGVASFSDTLPYDVGGKVINATATANSDSSGFSNGLAEFVKFPIVFPIHLLPHLI